MLIYLAMAIDLPSWAIKEIDKIRQAFLWKSRREVKGEHCLVARGEVCRPLELSGLGISSLKELCWALRMRWLWLAKTEPNRPWSSLQIQVPEKVHDFFAVAVQSDVGDGAHTLFWTDQWLHGQRILDLAPRLHALVKTRRAKKRTVLEVFINQAWMRDIQGALTVGAIVEFLQLGTFLHKCSYNQIPGTGILLGWPPMAITQPNLLMKVSLLVLFCLTLLKGFGSQGHHLSAAFLCGSLPIIDVGQQTDCKKEGWIIRSTACYVTKKLKQLIIGWLAVCLQDNFGFFG
jgi:hypothetical protein